ncbi:MAG: T9SS type A sorting domain-containing protein, partial [Flavobacteriales bacterium]|nr:T9SS type A sorting domain-containing protein [Flavobacteriales bacterium]
AFDAGVRVETSDLSLTKSTIRASRYGIYVTAGDPQIEFNIIKNNSILGLFNANSNDTVTACNNYWGDPSGPFNSTSNPTGLANGISDKVIAADCTKDALEIVCPDDMAFNVGDDYSTLVAGLVEVCINDCENKTVSFSDDDPDPQCTQDVIRTWTVSDTCGNLKTCDQILSFTDVIAPTIVCAADQVLVCNSPLPPIDTGAHSVSDNCAVDEVTFLGVQEDIVGCIHTYSRTYQVTDLEGNSATCVQEFEVKEDLFAPILSSLPSDFTVDCADFPAAPTITATDNCDGSLPVTFTEVLVEDQCGILLTRTWSVSDECGNEASHTQNILGDRGVITFVGLPSDLTIECSEAIPSIPTVTAEDNCGLVNITFSETSDYDCSGTILRTWVATDVCGSTAMHTQTITIVDDTAPVLSEYPADEVVACPEDIPSPATLTASDNCAVSLVVDFVETQSGLDVIRTWSTIDDCGNEESHTQTIVVLDDCEIDCSVFDTAPVDLTKSFDPVNGVQDRVQVKWFKASPEVRYSDEDAAACDIKAWPKRNLIPGTSTPTGPAIIAAPEDTIDIVNTKKFQPDGVTPRSIFKWPLKFRADGANNNKRVEPNIRYKWAVRCACEHGEGQESPWSEVKIFNTPDFNPVTGIYTPPSKPFENGNATKSIMELETSIYPNPSTGLIQLAIDADNFSYELIDIGGRVISTESINGSRAILDFSYLSEGIYMMRISAKGFYHIERIVIRR